MSGKVHPDLVVVDEHDRPVGQGRFADVRRQGLWHRSVLVLVFNPAGEFLLQKRGSQVVGPGLWDVSVGGHVDAGEGYLEAAQREAYEEVGVSGVPLEVMGKYTVDEEEAGNRVRQFVTVYRVVWDQEINADPAEVSDVKWISIPDLGKWMESAPAEFFRAVGPVYHAYLEPLALAEA